MARSLDQVLAELEPTYAGTRKIYQSRLDAIPGEIEAGIAQADAKLGVANENILNSARRRGLGFSGIPVGEQAKYAATDYAPAIANLRMSGQNKELSILEALEGVGREQRSQAQSIYDNELAREFQERQFQEQIRQFNEQQKSARAAAAAADISRYLGGNSAPAARVVQNGGSFAFYDANNAPITAAQYAKAQGMQIGDLLYQMGQAGDRDAAQLYNQLQMVADTPALFNKQLQQYARMVPHILGGV